MVPLVFWIFGPLLLLFSTIAMICVVYCLDRTPKMYCDYMTPFSMKSCKLE
jgi:hypothetical protein